jgi:hypothetical protein
MADKWWRVELSDDGKLQSVCEAEQSENGNRTYYVHADTEDKAAKEALRLYKLEQRIWREEERRTKGWCKTCGCPLDDEKFDRCARCRKTAQAAVSRFRDRGNQKIGRGRGPRKEPQLRAARRDVLLEVQKAWMDAPNNAAFSKWLTSAINELGPAPSDQQERGAA